MTGLAAVLETLNAHCTMDPCGRILAFGSEGVPPRFVLGRAAEGCVWRFAATLDDALVVGLARLAGREPGVAFEGELPAPPERLAALQRLLDGSANASTGASSGGSTGPRRIPVTPEGVAVGELWLFR